MSKQRNRNPYYCEYAEAITVATTSNTDRKGFIYVGTSGDVAVDMGGVASGSATTFKNCPAGELVGGSKPIYVTRIYPSGGGTTASDLLLCY